MALHLISGAHLYTTNDLLLASIGFELMTARLNIEIANYSATVRNKLGLYSLLVVLVRVFFFSPGR